MAGAVGAALRRLNAAIDKLLARRIANRPSAGVLANVLKPNLQHLADLRFGEEPCGLPLARDGGNKSAPPQRFGARDRGTARPLGDRSRRAGRGAMDIAGELDRRSGSPCRSLRCATARRAPQQCCSRFFLRAPSASEFQSPHPSTCPRPCYCCCSSTWRKRCFPCVREPRKTLAPSSSSDISRLYNMVNTTKRCVWQQGICQDLSRATERTGGGRPANRGRLISLSRGPGTALALIKK